MSFPLSIDSQAFEAFYSREFLTFSYLKHSHIQGFSVSRTLPTSSPLLHSNPLSPPQEPGEKLPFLKHATATAASRDLWHQSPALSWYVYITVYYFFFFVLFILLRPERQENNLKLCCISYTLHTIQHVFKHFQIK